MCISLLVTQHNQDFDSYKAQTDATIGRIGTSLGVVGQ
jgi:hypothetical protein